jgi:hypothetical protein
MSADVRFATIVLARLAARKAVKRQIQAEGRIKLGSLTSAEITALADAYLRAHRDELFAAAEASPIVQNLKVAHRRRAIDRSAKSQCTTHVQNGEPK